MEEKETEGLKEVNIKKHWWNSKSKSAKASFIVSTVLLVACVGFLITLLFARQIYPKEFADQLYHDAPNGFVAIANFFTTNGLVLFYSILTVVAAFLIGFVANFLIKIIFANASKRSKTTASIIRSLLKYVIVIAAAAILLTIWGVNVTGVVASLGILTLIIGLGCQSLINDVVSGLFIVFDDYFSVGDMVIIDGFRGYVSEIGLRAVKIDDHCGNIKSINNSSITSVINLSRQPNLITINMEASYFEDVERLEAIFARELPLIKERMPQIIEGPWYKGIDDFKEDGVSYKFAFTVKAEYRFQATRNFKREIYQMFVKNNIIVPFNQITINNADPSDRPKASEEEKKISAQINEINRAVDGKAKKVKFTQKVKKAYEDTMDEVDFDN